jgi:ubiquinone/menaquinone biosynthesis methyltransferase
MQTGKTNFGFKVVDEAIKSSLVKGVFSSVASRYDIMNDLMSGGMHRLWKKDFLNEIKPFESAKLLDLAAGTGDISFAFANLSKNKDFNVSCVTSDINEEMLKQAKNRMIDENLQAEIEFKIIDAENIPFPENSFDYVTIAFGIRNVTNIPKALSEINRVLKPTGKFACLEFSDVGNQNFKKLYDFYSFNIIPKLGELVAGDKDSYQYLVESIRLFPKAEDFKIMIEKANFKQVSYNKLTNGVVAIHRGFKE